MMKEAAEGGKPAQEFVPMPFTSRKGPVLFCYGHRETVIVQGLLADALRDGADSAGVQEKMRRFLQPERAKAITKNLRGAIDSAREADAVMIVLTARADEFEDGIHYLGGLITRGDYQEAATLISRFREKYHSTDEALHLAREAGVRIAPKAGEVAADAGGRELKGVIDEIFDDPLLTKERATIGLPDVCIQRIDLFNMFASGDKLVDDDEMPKEALNAKQPASARKLDELVSREETAGGRSRMRKMIEKGFGSGAAELFWRMVELTGDAGRRELAARLTRLETVWNTSRFDQRHLYRCVRDSVPFADSVDRERLMISWADGGCAEFLRKMSAVKSYENRIHFMHPLETEALEKLSELQSPAFQKGLIELYARLSCSLVSGARSGGLSFNEIPNYRMRFLQGLTTRLKELSGPTLMDEAPRIVGLKLTQAKLAELTHELHCLPAKEKSNLFNAILGSEGLSGAKPDAEADKLRKVFDESGLDIAKRLPSVLELLSLSNLLVAFYGRGTVEEPAAAMLLAARQREMLREGAEYLSDANPEGFSETAKAVSEAASKTCEMLSKVRYGDAHPLTKRVGFLSDEAALTGDLVSAAVELSALNPEAASNFWRTYRPSLDDIRWDGSGPDPYRFAKHKDTILSGEFRESLAGNAAAFARVCGMDGVAAGGKISATLAEAMCLGAATRDFVFEAETQDALSGSLGPKTHIAEELLGALSAGAVRKAKAYRTLMRVYDEPRRRAEVDHARSSLRFLTEDDLDGVNWADTRKMVSEIVSIGSDRRGFETAAAGLPTELRTAITELSKSAPKLKSRDVVETFKASAASAGPQSSAKLMDMAAALSERPGKAVELLSSRELTAALESLAQSPHSSALFVDMLAGRAGDLGTSPVAEVIAAVTADDRFKANVAVESVLDWTGVDAQERKKAVDYVLGRPDGQRMLLLTFTAREILDGPGLAEEGAAIAGTLSRILPAPQAVVEDGGRIFVRRDDVEA